MHGKVTLKKWDFFFEPASSPFTLQRGESRVDSSTRSWRLAFGRRKTKYLIVDKRVHSFDSTPCRNLICLSACLPLSSLGKMGKTGRFPTSRTPKMIPGRPSNKRSLYSSADGAARCSYTSSVF